jgi:hypothetical protein
VGEEPASDKPGKYTVIVRTRYQRYIGDYVLHCHRRRNAKSSTASRTCGRRSPTGPSVRGDAPCRGIRGPLALVTSAALLFFSVIDQGRP